MDRLRLTVRNRLSYFGAAGLQAQEELVDMLPDFGSAGEAAPVHADQADEVEALIDGNDVVLVSGTGADAPGNAQVVSSGLAAEENSATIAGAGDLALARIEQMLVNGCEFGAAKFTAFGAVGDGATAGNLPQE